MALELTPRVAAIKTPVAIDPGNNTPALLLRHRSKIHRRKAVSASTDRPHTGLSSNGFRFQVHQSEMFGHAGTSTSRWTTPQFGLLVSEPNSRAATVARMQAILLFAPAGFVSQVQNSLPG